VSVVANAEERRACKVLGVRRWLSAIFVFASLVLLGGCQTDVTVRVNQITDGSGEVTVSLLLDREAVEQAGDLRSTLRTADLESAGWSVTGPVPRPPGGFVEYTVSKPFRNAGEAQLILTELSGEEGPFAQLVIDRTRSPLRVVSSITGEVDLTKGYDAFGDEVIARQFQSESKLGLSALDFTNRYDKPLEELVPLHLEVTLADQPTQRIDLVPGQRTPVELRLVRWNRLILLPIGGALIGLFGLALTLRRR
jgi:hypothetical protein